MKEYVIQLIKTNKETKKKEIYVLGLDEEDNETLLLKDTDTSGGKKTLVFKFA